MTLKKGPGKERYFKPFKISERQEETIRRGKERAQAPTQVTGDKDHDPESKDQQKSYCPTEHLLAPDVERIAQSARTDHAQE